MKTVLNDNSTVAHYWAHQRQSEGRTGSGNMSFQGPDLYSYGLRIGKIVECMGQPLVLALNHGPTPTTNTKHLPAMRRAISHLPRVSVYDVPEQVTYGWACTELEYAIEDVKKEQKSIANKRTNIEWAIDHYVNVVVLGKRRLIEFVRTYPLVGLPFKPDEVLRLAQELEALLPLPDLAQLKEKTKATAAKEREARKAKDAQDKLAFEESLALWKANESTHLRRYGEYPQVTYLRLQGSPVFVETSKGVNIPLDEAKQAYIAFKRGRLLGQKLAGYTITQVDTAKQVVIAGCHTVPFSEIEEIGGKL